MEKFDDRYFPQVSLEFVSDFPVNEKRLYVIENGDDPLSFTFTSRNYTLHKPLDIIIFIDESTAFEKNFKETSNELMDLYRVVKENDYDAKLRIITSSENKNKAHFMGNKNLFAADESFFDELLDVIFNQQRYSVADFNTILEGFSKYEYDGERKLVFIIVSSGKEISSVQDRRYLTDRIWFKKSDPEIFVFSQNDSFYSEMYYENLVEDVGGVVLNPDTHSLEDVLDYYYGEELFKNVITYVSKERVTPQDYFIKLFFSDTKKQHEIIINSDYYGTVKINSVTATPFLIKPGEITNLKCMTTPVEGVVYNWICDSGNFDQITSSSNEIQWKAPMEVGEYTIKVRCSFKNSVAESETVVLVAR